MIEVLITRIINDIYSLAKNNAIKAIIKDQVKGLRDAIAKLLTIKPFMEPFEGSGNTFSYFGFGD